MTTLLRPIIALALCALTSLPFLPVAHADAGGTVPLPGSIARGLLHAQRLHPALAGSLPVAITLRPRNAAGLDQLLAAQVDPASSQYHHWLTPADFARRFGPGAAARDRVTNWLQSAGLQITGTSRNNAVVFARGSASTLQRTFATDLYTMRESGQTFVANTSALHIPAALASAVTGVAGLFTAPQHEVPRLMARKSSGPHGYNPAALKKIYNLTSLAGRGITGSGQTIAVASLAGYTMSNINTYARQFNLPTGNVTRVPVSDGTSSGSSLGAKAGQDETEADIEVVRGLAPRASILVYEAPNTDQGVIAMYSSIVGDNRASIVTTSWGDVESDLPSDDVAAMHQALQQAAAQGQAVFAASGDNGAYDGAGTGSGDATTLSVDYPASDPNVTGVGGTTLHVRGTTYRSETVWSGTGNTPVGSGGGLSSLFARPAYQVGPGVGNHYSNGMRQVPDVAADADPNTGFAGYTVDSRDNPRWLVFGGTSAAAPLWASFAALVNQAMNHRTGPLNPALYNLGQRAASLAASPFHDVTSGSNLYYPATTGWDFATGWGSFNGAAFVGALQQAAGPAPTVTVQQVLVLHQVNGAWQPTSTLRLGERGELAVLYSAANLGSMRVSGTATLRRAGSSFRQVALQQSLYQGKPALIAPVRITNKQRVGSLVAHVTVNLGTALAAQDRIFTLKG